MNHAPSSLRIAVLSLCLFCCNALAAEQSVPYDPAAGHLLRDIPVQLVLLNDELKVQLAYANAGLDPALMPNYYDNPVPGVPTGVGILAGALGASLGQAIANASLYEKAERAVLPAYSALQAAQCKLPEAASLSDGLERSIRSSTWGTATPVNRLVVGPQQRLDKLLDTEQPRQVLLASYSMSPDFSTLITSVDLSVYSNVVAGGRKRWQTNPAWSNLLIVFSRQVALPPKLDQDIAELVSTENARFARTSAGKLISAANDGDAVARKKAHRLVSEHEQYLREAKKKKWTPAMTAARNSRYWIADGCAALAAAMESNARELEMLLAQLYAGELPPALSGKTTLKEIAQRNMEPDPTPPEHRRVTAELGNTYLSRFGQDRVVPFNLRSWYSP